MHATNHQHNNEEVVPDSEEERPITTTHIVVIEISSDEEGLNKMITLDNPFLTHTREVWSTDKPTEGKTSDFDNMDSIFNRVKPFKSKPRRKYHTRRIVESSDSGHSESDPDPTLINREIIELSDSSLELPGSRNTTTKRPKNNDTKPVKQMSLSLHLDGEDAWNNDGSILTLNEPKGARKPIRLLPDLIQDSTKLSAIGTPHKHPKGVTGPRPTLVGITLPNTPITPSTSTSVSPTKSKQAARTGKKALAVAELQRRELYAQQLFTELNHVVFRDGLPKETKLNWSKRLLTTAGKARWHRSRDGVQTTEIELAEKILDCDERIRNTLSHEMCHLASWIIDGDPKQCHGALWKAWASKVMRKRPEIEITTRHDYEISYPFKWKCEQCEKIYGRFSKSIRPDESVCGVCKEGKLIPLFSQRAKTPKMPKMSQMASAKPQDSPKSISRPQPQFSEVEINSPSVLPNSRMVHTIRDSDSEYDSEIAILTMAIDSVTINVAETD